MPDITRGERKVQFFAQVISNPKKMFTISDLMETTVLTPPPLTKKKSTTSISNYYLSLPHASPCS